MTIPLKLGRDTSGAVTYSTAFSSIKYEMNLLVGAAQTITLPTECKSYYIMVIPEPGGLVCVSPSATAAYPSSATPAITQSEPNPGVKIVNGGTTLSLVTPNDSCMVWVQIYAVQ